jgi:hypothetical protein
LPRRLGDDPLTRARAERAKAAEASASVAVESGVQQQAAQVGVQASSRASYNDVFFQRRGEGGPSQQTAQPRAPEAPEITEISEIPEIREAAAASVSRSPIEVPPGARTEAVVPPAAEVAQAAPVSIIEEVVARLDANAAIAAPAAATSLQVKEEPASPSTASQAPSSAAEQPEPQKGGGFFKRLFGKFGK